MAEKDLFHLHGVSDEGLVGERNGEEGVLRPLREGQPVYGEIVEARLSSEPGVLQLTTLHKGPARASTRAYRQGYDRVFGKREEKNLDLN